MQARARPRSRSRYTKIAFAGYTTLTSMPSRAMSSTCAAPSQLPGRISSNRRPDTWKSLRARPAIASIPKVRFGGFPSKLQPSPPSSPPPRHRLDPEGPLRRLPVEAPAVAAVLAPHHAGRPVPVLDGHAVEDVRRLVDVAIGRDDSGHGTSSDRGG